MRENPMRAIAVAILTISQLTLVPFVNKLSTNSSIRPAVAVIQPEQNRNVTVIYKRDGVGTVVDRPPGLSG
jgi:hypothetical protein